MKTYDNGKVVVTEWKDITPSQLDKLDKEGYLGIVNGDAKLVFIQVY